MILAMPLKNNSADSWYWGTEKSDNYSVKSAYAMLQDSHNSVHYSNNSGFWRRLWNLKIPAKVKQFLWSAATECLPTRSRLIEKRVRLNAICPMCNEDVESSMHIFIQCSFVVECFISIGRIVDDTDITSFAKMAKTSL